MIFRLAISMLLWTSLDWPLTGVKASGISLYHETGQVINQCDRIWQYVKNHGDSIWFQVHAGHAIAELVKIEQPETHTSSDPGMFTPITKRPLVLSPTPSELEAAAQPDVKSGSARDTFLDPETQDVYNDDHQLHPLLDNTDTPTPARGVDRQNLNTGGDNNEAVGEETNEAVDAVGEETNDAVEAVGEETNEAVDAGGEETNDAVEAVGEETNEAAEAVGEEAKKAVEAVGGETNEAVEAAGENTNEAVEAAGVDNNNSGDAGGVDEGETQTDPYAVEVVSESDVDMVDTNDIDLALYYQQHVKAEPESDTAATHTAVSEVASCIPHWIIWYRLAAPLPPPGHWKNNFGLCGLVCLRVV